MGEATLVLSYPRLFDVAINKQVSVKEMCLWREGGVGRDWRWRRCFKDSRLCMESALGSQSL